MRRGGGEESISSSESEDCGSLFGGLEVVDVEALGFDVLVDLDRNLEIGGCEANGSSLSKSASEFICLSLSASASTSTSSSISSSSSSSSS